MDETSAGGLVVDHATGSAAVIGRLDRKGRLLWSLPKGHIEPGETAEEAVKRELVEEAAFQIDVLKPLYLSENLFVESGEYRHEVILYFLAAVHARLDTPPTDLRNHEWHPPSATPRPLLPPDVAGAVIFDLETGFKRPLQHFVCDERPAERPA